MNLRRTILLLLSLLSAFQPAHASTHAKRVPRDERTIADRSTYERPELLAAGMRYVVVNGRVVVEGGSLRGRSPAARSRSVES